MAKVSEALITLKAKASRYVVNSNNNFLMVGLLWARICTFSASKFLGKRYVEVYVDSHADVLNYVRLPNVWFNVCSVRGATAFGVANPNSKTNSAKIFQYYLDGIHQKKDLVYLMGEVDCGFLIWLLSKKRGVAVTDLLNEAIANYTSFIKDNSKYAKRVIVISAPLPTIEDGAIVGEIAKARNEVQVPQIERTKLTLEFNQAVKKFCTVNDFDFVALDESSLGGDGYVKSSLKNKNEHDHHYDIRAYVKMLGVPLMHLLCDE